MKLGKSIKKHPVLSLAVGAAIVGGAWYLYKNPPKMLQKSGGTGAGRPLAPAMPAAPPIASAA